MFAVRKGVDYQFGDKYEKFQNKKQIFKYFFSVYGEFYPPFRIYAPKTMIFKPKYRQKIWNY